jgi:dehydrogenase
MIRPLSISMLAAIVPAVNRKWELKELPIPEPGINQVLIKIYASGLCYTDIHMTEGTHVANFPNTLGHEPAGMIVSIGEGVTTRKIGDRVGVPWVQSTCGRCEWCQRDKGIFCHNQIGTGVNIPGSHAEYMVAYADSTQLLPDALSYEQAAPIFCAGFTVYSGLLFAEPKPHERIAVVGIGGLGHLALQYSKVAGFETIALTHSKDKEELAYKLGANGVVSDGKGLASYGNEGKENSGGVDIILATTNSYKAMTDSFQGLRPDGRIILMGISSNETLTIPENIIYKRGQIKGSMANDRQHLYEALDYVAKGNVKVMTEIFSLEKINDAYDKVSNGEVRFRAVIKPET